MLHLTPFFHACLHTGGNKIIFCTLLLFTQILNRAEKWPSLLATLLASALKCAFLCCRLSPYTAISLELCRLEAGEEGRVWGNLMLVLLSGKPPLPEPSLTGKSERASVANATKGWIKLLEGEQQSAVEEVDLTDFASCLEVTLTLPETATVGEV